MNFIYIRFQIRNLLKTIESAFFKKERNRLYDGIPKVLEQSYKIYFQKGEEREEHVQVYPYNQGLF